MKEQKQDYTLFYISMIVILSTMLIITSIFNNIEIKELKETNSVINDWLYFELITKNITIGESTNNFINSKFPKLPQEGVNNSENWLWNNGEGRTADELIALERKSEGVGQ